MFCGCFNKFTVYLCVAQRAVKRKQISNSFFFSALYKIQVPSMLSTSLNAEALQFLQSYLQAATVQLV